MASSALLEMSKQDYQDLQKLPGNDKCVDCGVKNPEWGSISFGTLFCAACSGSHRGLGVHISRVRSIKMDSWSKDQIQRMKLGGNEQCKDFFLKYGMTDFDDKAIRERYDSPQAELYKGVLDARIAGTAEPTELPKPKKKQTSSSSGGTRKMEGFGSSPPPSQTDTKGRGMKLSAYVILSAFVTWYLVLKDDS